MDWGSTDLGMGGLRNRMYMDWSFAVTWVQDWTIGFMWPIHIEIMVGGVAHGHGLQLIRQWE